MTKFTLFQLSIILASLPACATINTVSNAKPGNPIFFSGTRLNLNAIQNDQIAMKKYNVSPPDYPLLDLPGSVIIDLIFAPLTSGVALFEVLTE